MKIGIISDSHDNLPNIYKAVDYLKANGVEVIIHCGDVCAPSVMREIVLRFAKPLHLVFGNVDGDCDRMTKLAKDLPDLTLHGEQGEVELADKKFAFVHYPIVAQQLAQSGKYDVVFYGHDHRAWQKNVGNCQMINPGTLAGLFAKPTFAIFDTDSNTAQLVLIEKI